MHRQTVSDAPLGQPLTVAAVAADPRVIRRLAELGVRPGAKVAVLRRTAGGGRILNVADARVALDAATARVIELSGSAA
jgi:ferrous iron transport protein A